MSSYKKWLGGGMGWLLGGPVGGLLGFALGSVFEGRVLNELKREFHVPLQSPESDFRLSLLLLSAVVIKADGQATKVETEYVRDFFIRKFGLEKTNESMRMFNTISRQGISVEEISMQVRRLIDYSSRLQLVHYLFSVAKADGSLTDDEVRIINKISTLLGLHHTEFSSIYGMFYSGSRTIICSYKILGVQKSDSDEVIKRAYRKLTLKYHPDKVAHLGESVQREAREKYERVLEAYDKIKKERSATAKTRNI